MLRRSSGLDFLALFLLLVWLAYIIHSIGKPEAVAVFISLPGVFCRRATPPA
jgi:hypothetical protein